MDKPWSKMTNKERSRDLVFELRWPEFAACMVRAADSSGVPFAVLARAAEAARKALAECGQSTWLGAVSGDWNDPHNWLYSRLPARNDLVVFNSRSGDMATRLDAPTIEFARLIMTDDFKGTIGKRGRTL